MSNEIEEYKKSDWLSKEEKTVIDRQFFPHGASVDDKRFCMQVAEQLNLNPLLKQIYFVPRKTNIGTQQNPNWVEKVEPIAGRDSYLTLAHRTGQFAGIESYVKIEPRPTLNDKGKWINEDDLVAYATVYKKGFDKPFTVSVRYTEYAQKTNKGDVTKFWKEKPETMLKKVAESQVLRKAFNITGLYDESELGDNETSLNVNNTNKLEKPKQQQNINDINALALPTAKQEENKDIEIDFVPESLPAPKERLRQELIKRGLTGEEAGKWLYNKSDDVYVSYLNDPASIDTILEEIQGF
ncbi:phage recombination protein Bet [Arcobacter sp. FW59]|nr:phage recombination protein Bet [Arcobacter sp. FW59]